MILRLFDTRECVPLNTGQNGCHVVSGAPAILQNVKAELARPVDVGMEHLADELDTRGLVGVLLFEVHHEAESAILKGGVRWADNHSIPKQQDEVRY